MMATGKSGIPVYIRYPLTLEFEISSHYFAAGNKAEFTIFNLNKGNRDALLIDYWMKTLDGFPITLNAGYRSQQSTQLVVGDTPNQSSLPQIFSGFINEAYTTRVGSDLLTRIDAVDNGNIASELPPADFPPTFSVAANEPFADMVKRMMALLVNVKVGEVLVTPARKPYVTKAWTPVGKVWDVLQTVTPPGANLFIFNGTCHMLGQNDTLPVENGLRELSVETGLLNIPKYTGNGVVCTCIFEPTLAIGREINLKSEHSKAMNGKYKIVQYDHSGTISGATSGDATSTITLQRVPMLAGVLN